MAQKNNWVALSALVLASLIVGLDATVLNVALPTIAADLHATTSSLQWIVNAYVLALAGLMLPAGVLGDLIGRKKMLLVGLAIFFGGSLGAALTGDTHRLIAWRIVMGAGAAIIMPITLALLPVLFDDEQRPKAVAITAAAVSIGVPLGPIVGGYLLEHYAWSSIFWINVPIVVVAFFAVSMLIPESRDPLAKRLDVPGAVMSILGIVMVVYGLVEAPNAGWLSGQTIGLVLGGFVILTGFAMWQARTPTPLIDFRLFQNQRFVGGTIAMVLANFVLYGMLFTLPQFLQDVRGNDALGTGIRLIPMMAGILVAAVISKRVLVKVGAGVGTVAGLLILSAGLAGLSRLAVNTTFTWIGLGLGVIGLGAGVAMTSAMDAMLGSLPQAQVGAGSGINSALRQVGGALGVAILGSVLSSVYSNRLDDRMLSQLPAPVASAVRDSIGVAVQVAGKMGSAGDAVQQMARVSFTDAMSVLLLISAIAGVIAAVISGWVLRERPNAPEQSQKPAELVTEER